jgi:hypothetical protein
MTSQDRDSATAAIPNDNLAQLVGSEDQRTAAHMAQDTFARIFRLTLTEDDEGRARGVNELSDAIRQWADADATEESASLRLALLLSGLDQWGVAYSRAFGLQAIPGLTELVGALRTELDPQAEARFEQQYGAIEAAEGNAIDFKVELRRGIHLALWHAMIASDDREQATQILTQLGGMLFSLVRLMPELGWRLVADALANIQIHCLAEGLATDGLAREMTESLFAALAQELPAERRDLIMTHSARSVLAWQEARRAPPGQIH